MQSALGHATVQKLDDQRSPGASLQESQDWKRQWPPKQAARDLQESPYTSKTPQLHPWSVERAASLVLRGCSERTEKREERKERRKEKKGKKGKKERESIGGA